MIISQSKRTVYTAPACATKMQVLHVKLLMIIRTGRTVPQTHGSFFAKGKDVPGAVGERLRRWISEQKGDKSMADGRVGSGI